MRESQYIEDYLDAAEEHRWTPGTFLTYTLEGIRAINRRVSEGAVIAVPSAGGSTAYIREGGSA